MYTTFQGTQREYIDAFKACMESQGIHVNLAEDGGMTFPGATNDSVTIAGNHCLQQIGIIQTRNFTEKQLRSYYAVQSAQWQCIRDAGYPVAPAQTWQTYLDTAQQTGAPYWDVFAGLARDQVGAALADCPNKVAG